MSNVNEQKVVFNDDGIEERVGLRDIYLRVSEISSMEELNQSWTCRITMHDGRRFIVDDRPDVLIHQVIAEKKEISGGEGVGSTSVDDLHSFKLVKEERQPQSWLGRLFADASSFIKGDAEPLPPIRVTHDRQGRKLSRTDLQKIYSPDGALLEARGPSAP